MATEAADLRVKVEATGTAETVGELMAVDKAIDMVGDDSLDASKGVDAFSTSTTSAGESALSWGTALKGLGIGGLVVALAPLIPMISTLGAQIGGLAAAAPGILALGGAFAYVGRNALLASTHTDNLADAFAKLTEKGQPLGDALAELKRHASSMTDEFMGFINDVGPKLIGNFTQVVDILEQHLTPVLDMLSREAKQWGDLMVESARRAAGPLTALVGGLSDTFQRLMKAFLPAIKPALQGLNTIIEGLGKGLIKWLTPMIPFIKMVSRGLGGFLADLGKQLGRISKALAPSMIASFKMFHVLLKGLGDILVALAPAIRPLVNLLTGIFKAIIPVAVALLKALVPALKMLANTITPLLPMIGKVLAQAIKDLTPLFLELIKAVVPLIPSIVKLTVLGLKVMLNILPLVIPFLTALVKWFNALAKPLVKLTERVVKFVEQWVNRFTKWVRHTSRAIKDVIRFFQELPGRIWNAVSGLAGRLAEWGGNLLARAWDRIKEKGTQILTWFKELPGRLWNWVSGIPSKMFEAGANIIQGLWDGIASVWDGFVSWFTDKLSWLKRIPGASLLISSPSRVYKGYGKNLIQGLVQGIRQELPNLGTTMRSVTDQLHAEGTFGVKGRGQLAVAGAGGQVHGTLRIVGTRDLYAIIDARVDAGTKRRADFDQRMARMGGRK